MPVNSKAIKLRIRSVVNTKKITKAMELVSAAKMRRSVETALGTRIYAKRAWDLLVHLSQTEAKKMPLMSVRPVERLLVILVTSNRGLCGSFNANIIKKTLKQLAHPTNMSRHRNGRDASDTFIEPKETIEIEVIGVGKRGSESIRKMGHTLIAVFTDLSDTPRLRDILPIAKMAIDGYAEKKWDKVVVAYTDFRSSLFQEPKLRQVLPVSAHDLEKMIAGIGITTEEKKKQFGQEEQGAATDYLFEPNGEAVLKTILPRLVETQIYQAVLESAASEHSARMVAMKQAREAATEMIDDLTLEMNKARQAAITQEIAEIAGGAAALG